MSELLIAAAAIGALIFSIGLFEYWRENVNAMRGGTKK